MKVKVFKPQMTQMGADVFSNGFTCGNLRHLWLNESDEVLRGDLGRIRL